MENTSTTNPDDNFFPIVGVGASAGGLEAFEKLFTGMPVDSGIAFIIVQHLDPTHESMLVDLLQRYTDIPVSQVENGERVEPNHVYVIPPNRDMALMHGELHLMQPSAPRGFRLPIDYFFRSLAEDLKDRAICIVLSGTGSDGSLGIRAIKEVGGMAITQDPETAKYTGMPHSAIATGVVDLSIPVEEMPDALKHYVEESLLPNAQGKRNITQSASELLRKVFIILRDQTGHDFSLYKPSTISRRIERRMTVNQIKDLNEYIQYLRENALEVETLFKELLIGVTSFFRDTEAFESLADNVLEDIIKQRADNNNKGENESIRIWVTGCSTGEEAYSISMLVHDKMQALGKRVPVQVFATDIDQSAIEKARTGIYPDNIVADVPPHFLQRFFDRENSHYQVSKQIRSTVVFAEQSIIKDPPFSRVDLISCRNLLIYLSQEIQRDVIPMFHYALKPDGYLFLGTSESLGNYNHIFSTVDKRWKLFRKLESDIPPQTSFNFTSLSRDGGNQSISRTKRSVNYGSIIESALIDRYAHPAVIVDDQGEILYFHGDTSDYLRPAKGEATLNVLRMARDGVRMSLTTALRKVIIQRQEILYEHLHIERNGTKKVFNMVLLPINRAVGSRRVSIIIFEELRNLTTSDDVNDMIVLEKLDEGEQRILELEQELQSTREYLQTTIEELETSNEELKSTNEELQSSNEELQSTNEELETAKEELQSVNEELITVNAELNSKIEQLDKTNNDQSNLLQSMEVGIVFLDTELEVQLFNTVAGNLLNLREPDTGRPLRHFASNFDYTNLTDDLEYVLDTLENVNREILSQDDRWYTMQLRPYRTTEGAITGVVVTFADITEQIEAQKNLAKYEQIYHLLARHLSYLALFVFDSDLRYVVVEGELLDEVGFDTDALIGKTLHQALPHESVKEIEDYYNAALEGQEVTFERTFGDLNYTATASPLRDENGKIVYGMILVDDKSPMSDSLD